MNKNQVLEIFSEFFISQPTFGFADEGVGLMHSHEKFAVKLLVSRMFSSLPYYSIDEEKSLPHEV